jgi:hypothetical protein
MRDARVGPTQYNSRQLVTDRFFLTEEWQLGAVHPQVAFEN